MHARPAGRGGASVVALLAWLLFPQAGESGETPPSLHARRVEIAAQARVGDIRLLGALELAGPTVNGLRFAELSGLAWDDDEEILYALSDQGALFWLKPVFRDGFLSDVHLLKALPLREPVGNTPVKWKRSDAEGLDIVKGRNGRMGDAELLASFERLPRIVAYRPDGTALREHALPERLSDIRHYASPNEALEAVAFHPAAGIVTAPQAPLRGERPGIHRLYSLKGVTWTYPLQDARDIVAMEALPDGALLILERRFEPLTRRFVIAFKRLPALPPGGGDLPAPRELATLTSDGFQIDNFEGLARQRGNRFFMVSDNNDAFLQRTLLVHFEVLDEGPSPRDRGKP